MPAVLERSFSGFIFNLSLSADLGFLSFLLSLWAELERLIWSFDMKS